MSKKLAQLLVLPLLLTQTQIFFTLTPAHAGLVDGVNAADEGQQAPEAAAEGEGPSKFKRGMACVSAAIFSAQAGIRRWDAVQMAIAKKNACLSVRKYSGSSGTAAPSGTPTPGNPLVANANVVGGSPSGGSSGGGSGGSSGSTPSGTGSGGGSGGSGSGGSSAATATQIRGCFAGTGACSGINLQGAQSAATAIESGVVSASGGLSGVLNRLAISPSEFIQTTKTNGLAAAYAALIPAEAQKGIADAATITETARLEGAKAAESLGLKSTGTGLVFDSSKIKAADEALVRANPKISKTILNYNTDGRFLAGSKTDGSGAEGTTDIWHTHSSLNIFQIISNRIVSKSAELK